MERLNGMVMVVLVAVMVAAMIGEVNGRLVWVGGTDSWKPGVNYTQWASQQTFYAGDWIGFRFDKYMYDVVEVNETGYKDCNNNFMTKNITRGGGKDVYQLNETRAYYFICTKGYCWNGMKVAFNVSLPLPPAPAPQGNRASHGISTPLWVLAISVFMAFFMAHGYCLSM